MLSETSKALDTLACWMKCRSDQPLSGSSSLCRWGTPGPSPTAYVQYALYRPRAPPGPSMLSSMAAESASACLPLGWCVLCCIPALKAPPLLPAVTPASCSAHCAAAAACCASEVASRRTRPSKRSSILLYRAFSLPCSGSSRSCARPRASELSSNRRASIIRSLSFSSSICDSSMDLLRVRLDGPCTKSLAASLLSAMISESLLFRASGRWAWLIRHARLPICTDGRIQSDEWESVLKKGGKRKDFRGQFQ